MSSNTVQQQYHDLNQEAATLVNNILNRGIKVTKQYDMTQAILFIISILFGAFAGGMYAQYWYYKDKNAYTQAKASIIVFIGLNCILLTFYQTSAITSFVNFITNTYVLLPTFMITQNQTIDELSSHLERGINVNADTIENIIGKNL